MLSLRCTRCHRHFASRELPAADVRCRACHGPLRLEIPPPVRALPGSYAAPGEVYPSLDEFLAADARRVPSPERDFGLRWLDADGRLFRAAWVRGTCELVLVQAGDPADGGGHVEVLGVADGERELASALWGWSRVHGRPGSADWLRQRAAARLGASAGAAAA